MIEDILLLESEFKSLNLRMLAALGNRILYVSPNKNNYYVLEKDYNDLRKNTYVGIKLTLGKYNIKDTKK